MNILDIALIKSPWVFHFNAGSCNGCDIEILSVLTPKYDVERFGIKLVGTPKHADVLLVTGPVNMKAYDRLKIIYDQIPDPKVVVVVGTCGSSKGIFDGSYALTGPVENVIPVDVYIPGCPPRPEAIISGIYRAVQKLPLKKKRW